MGLIHIKDQLIRASKEGYAVPLFDVFEMQGAAGVFEAIEEKKTPAIVAIYSQLINLPDAEAFSSYLKKMAELSNYPVSIMLDHGSTVDQCRKAISFGFTDVMIDGSSLPVEENVKMTCEVVQMAHSKGIGVEAELGHVGNAAEYEDFAGKKQGFTDPQIVKPFIEETGVDFLAIAFGTAHGVFKGQPQLDLNLVKEVRKLVDIPLVMHGGSGLSNEQFTDAIKAGIAKVNVATNLMINSTIAIKTAATKEDSNLFTMMASVKESYHKDCGDIFELFGSAGKGVI